MLNYGEFVRGDDFDPDLHDAGGFFVTLRAGASFFDSVTSSEIARGGRLFAVVPGSWPGRRPGAAAAGFPAGPLHAEEIAAGFTVDEELSVTGMTVDVAGQVRVMRERWI